MCNFLLFIQHNVLGWKLQLSLPCFDRPRIWFQVHPHTPHSVHCGSGVTAFSFTSSPILLPSRLIPCTWIKLCKIYWNILTLYSAIFFFPLPLRFENIPGLRSSERNNKRSVSSLSKSIGHGNSSSSLMPSPLKIIACQWHLDLSNNVHKAGLERCLDTGPWLNPSGQHKLIGQGLWTRNMIFVLLLWAWFEITDSWVEKRNM